ncbi:unnamed protein product [Ceratitis capitata]|uniref:(Mediterranean fruit fly) hypothetical protein n=1 Tax=Ceratitis capitata TaxID=7213 RepID=A0A811VEX2_CERCA|nr:unnamed protein product [Ceratitis capitata]
MMCGLELLILLCKLQSPVFGFVTCSMAGWVTNLIPIVESRSKRRYVHPANVAAYARDYSTIDGADMRDHSNIAISIGTN